VLALPEPYDALLGDGWLTEHGVMILYDKKCLEIITKKRKYVIPTVSAPTATSYTPTPNTDPRILSLNYMQYKRSVKQGSQSILCFVQKEGVLQPEAQDHSDFTEQEKGKLVGLVERFKDIFGSKLHMDAVPHPDMANCIDMIPGAKTPYRPLYRRSPIETTEIETQVQQMLAQGLIEPSVCPYGAPVRLVKKNQMVHGDSVWTTELSMQSR
jgi:hypothetical protein